VFMFLAATTGFFGLLDRIRSAVGAAGESSITGVLSASMDREASAGSGEGVADSLPLPSVFDLFLRPAGLGLVGDVRPTSADRGAGD